ncbi:MAG: alpha/beta fold hydrolase [Promethearchaeota archaeon]|nr:MAG: alpha/beta fold hydrolase [Candidatus Lokiarchaeota archaeon]
MKILRTPDQRFNNLPDFSYSPNYLQEIAGFGQLRMHFIDEGPKNAKFTFLCLHGQPTWSFLYRKMVPIFTAAGFRVVAPDFIGFGRSDKPMQEDVYTFYFHRNTLINLINRLDLKNIILVCQDWGGILGLTLPMDMPKRFSKMIIMNTILATGDFQLSEGFIAWREWSNKNPDMEIGKLMKRSCPHLTEKECAAYNAPFPDITYKAGVRRFPNLVPDHPDVPGAEIAQKARKWFKDEWSGDVFMAIGKIDPVLGIPMMKILKNLINNCPEPYILNEAGHFVQEWGEEVAKKALNAFKLG